MTTTATPNLARIRQAIQNFDFTTLFIEELGWERFKNTSTVSIGAEQFTLRPVAQKRGFAIFACDPNATGGIPDYQTRRKIDAEARKIEHEHLIIYQDANQSHQIWQWVRRQHGKTDANREQPYFKGQSGERLSQLLAKLYVDMWEEDDLSVAQIAERAASAFDRDKVTKKFYNQFQTEHKKFVEAIVGIADPNERDWYASLMLNRLMFSYFIQLKGFLDGKTDYLRRKLGEVQARFGSDQFHTFYREFLLHFFHHGLGAPENTRTAEIRALLGNIPYLNGGLFEEHTIEQRNHITIRNAAFVSIFDFFDAWDWHLDDRPMRTDNEINPDVLGYIFEKYINQKQMGAYYTKEDITGYISRNTILPFLFESARKDCAIAFEPDGEIWRLLNDDPDRYIYDAVLIGVDLDLPAEIEAGITNVSQRGGWNRPAAEGFALPTETWREHVARRTRCLDLRAKLANGEITEVNDLITYNLDIVQFAQDVVERCEGPDLLRAFWKALTTVTVLDPTCGSGAFLFAALRLLEPLYEASLLRMESFVAEFDREGHTQRGPDFRDVLARVRQHPNRSYFIRKEIILNNLYGVDIMEEAVEIAKLRLFLSLVSQVEDARHLEPLPDIDFNIRAGNTLVGFTTLDAVRQAMTYDVSGHTRKLLLDVDDEAALARVEQRAAEIGRAYQHFQKLQSEFGIDAAAFHAAKDDLRRNLNTLGGELDRYLAREYGIAAKDDLFRLQSWRASHQPFHWFVEFYAIVQERGGFDIIIGNPPYVEYTKIKSIYQPRGFTTIVSGNLYGMVTEAALKIGGLSSHVGLILPMSLVSTPRMKPVRDLITSSSEVLYLSHYSGNRNPSVLFEGVEMRLTICLAKRRSTSLHARSFSTGFRRWAVAARENLFETTYYFEVPMKYQSRGNFPKLGNGTEAIILNKVEEVSRQKTIGDALLPNSSHRVYAHRIASYFVKALTFIPHFSNQRDGTKRSDDYKIFVFAGRDQAAAACCLINSSLFYMYYIVFSDAYHCGRELIEQFPTDISRLTENSSEAAVRLESALMSDLTKHSATRRIEYRNTGMVEMQKFFPKFSKPIIDEIDRVLARHYGFTDEELDFIINYDIKYRMGADNGENEDEDTDGERS